MQCAGYERTPSLAICSEPWNDEPSARVSEAPQLSFPKAPFPKRLNLEALCLPGLRQRPLFREPRMRTLRPSRSLPARERDDVGDRARRGGSRWDLADAGHQGRKPHAV